MHHANGCCCSGGREAALKAYCPKGAAVADSTDTPIPTWRPTRSRNQAYSIFPQISYVHDDALMSLRQLAEDELGMDALVEVHTSDEMKRAVSCGAQIIGVNNRDLRTFEVTLETSLSLAREAPREALLISESGLHSPDDLRRLRAAGYQGFLIGETLMRADDPAQAVRQFTNDVN